MSRQDTSGLVSSFFERGGAIQKCAEASPTTAKDVMEYLESQNIVVECAPDKDKQEKFICGGDAVDLQGLVQIANRIRRRQRRAPFEMAMKIRRR